MTTQVSYSDSGLFRFIHDCGHPGCRGFEDMKDEISSSLTASDTLESNFGLKT